jgi:hypothetical protein
MDFFPRSATLETLLHPSLFLLECSLSSSLPRQFSFLMLTRKQILIRHAHERDHTAHNRAHAREKGHPTLVVDFRNLYMQWTHLVKEENTRHSASASRRHMPQMFRDAVLVRLDRCAVAKAIECRNNLK